jgi:DNA repair and recombination protein RAD52
VANPTNGPQTSLQHQITPASVTRDRIPPQPNQPPQRKVTFSNAPNQSARGPISRPAEPIASSSKMEPEIDNFVEESFGYSEDDDFFASVDLGDLDRPIEDDGDIGRPINFDEDLGNPPTTNDSHRFHVGAPPGNKDLGNPLTTNDSHRFHVGAPPGNKDLGNPPTTKDSHRFHVGAPPPKPGPATGMLSALLPQQPRRAPQGQNIPPAKPMTFTKRTATPSIGGFHFPSGMVCLVPSVRARLIIITIIIICHRIHLIKIEPV